MSHPIAQYPVYVNWYPAADPIETFAASHVVGPLKTGDAVVVRAYADGCVCREMADGIVYVMGATGATIRTIPLSNDEGRSAAPVGA
jgi:hypothetical protein